MENYNPLHYNSVRELVRYAAEKYGDRDFLRSYQDSQIKGITFKQFLANAYAVGAWAMELSSNYGKSVKVAMLSPNSALYLTMLVGVMCGGGVSAPIDPQMKLDSLCNCLNKAEIDILIYDKSISLDRKAIYESCSSIKDIFYMKDEENNDCEDIIRNYKGIEGEPEIAENDCASIIFTSGTTGEEKGVMLSHANWADSAFHDFLHPQVQLSILPFHHAYGFNVDGILALGNGSTTCFGLGMDKLGESLQIFQPTDLHMVPMVAQALYAKIELLSKKSGKTPEECKPLVLGNNLVEIITGGAHLPAELVKKYQAIGIRIFQGYGMTEYSPTISSPYEDRPDKAFTAGHIVKGCVSRVVDEELQVKGPSLMLGYINAPELTAEVITEDGWLRTGDIGYEDEEGFIHIEGRKKNLIILSNGENVAPEQLEKLLLDHQFVKECLVYGEGTQIVAEIYPDPQYVKQNKIEDIPAEVASIVADVNDHVPSTKKIMKFLCRKTPLQKTSTNKIVRKQRASAEDLFEAEENQMLLPIGEVQTKLYEIVAEILDQTDFGTDTNLFDAGMDSMGCIMTLTTFSDVLDFHIELDEFMANPTILKLEALYNEKQNAAKTSYTKRPIYPLMPLQLYFAYILKGNTTANIPFLYKLDESVDMDRLKKAVEDLFEIHPIMKGVIQMFQNKGLAMFRNDDKKIDIPVYEMSEEEWMETKDGLVVPYLYTKDEPLYHIALYNVEGEKFLFFDIAHIISDGVSLGILLRDLEKLYAGIPVKAETYTFYDNMLEEQERKANGSRLSNTLYFDKILSGKHIDRSILAKSGNGDLTVQRNTTIYGNFDDINHTRLGDFCKKNGISKNILFLNAFNYCISIFSDEDDTISTSIHSGRTDSRWGNVLGSFFMTYCFRYQMDSSRKITDALASSAKQVMETMCCHVNNVHADEMFFQYQGDLFSDLEIGGKAAVNVPLQLDSLPFHLMVYENKTGYSYELRFWENRLDGKLIGIFMKVYEAIVRGMIRTEYVSGLRNYIPKKYLVDHKTILIGNDKHEVTILNRYDEIQPVGGWGKLYLDGTDTGRIARLNWEDQIDYLEDSGRMVSQEITTARFYINLNSLKNAFESYPGVDHAETYGCYGEPNQFYLTAELTASADLDLEALKAFAAEQFKVSGQPSKLFVNGELIA